MSEPPLCFMIACVWLLLAEAADLKRDAYAEASVLLVQCQIKNEVPCFLSVAVSLSD